MDIEAINEHLGGFGRYQIQILLLASILSHLTGFPYIQNLISTETTNYRCIIEESANDTGQLVFYDYLGNELFENANTSEWKQCFYSINDTFNTDGLDYSTTDVKLSSCQQWEYDTSVFWSTAATEFDLSCQRDWMRHLARSFYMVGMLVGAFVIGTIGDKYGRQKAALTSFGCMGISGAISAFSMNYAMFLICQALLGAGTIGGAQLCFLIVVEIVDVKWRCESAFVMTGFMQLSKGYGTVIAYYIRNWKWLSLALSVPSLAVLPLVWLMPENIRWLLVKGRTEEAIENIEKIAEMNKKEVPKHLMYPAQIKEKTDLDKRKCSTYSGVSEVTMPKKSILDIMRSTVLRKTMLILMYSWFLSSTIYYGVAANSENLEGDLFRNLMITMFVDFPANIAAIFLNKQIGRKATIGVSASITGLVCISCLFLDADIWWQFLLINSLAKAFITITFNSLYLYSSELFPTMYRSSCFGVCSMLSRIGGISSPFLASLGSVYKPLPLLIMGGLGVSGGFLFAFVPETSQQALPQTLEECEEMAKGTATFSFSDLKLRKSKLEKNSSQMKE